MLAPPVGTVYHFIVAVDVAFKFVDEPEQIVLGVAVTKDGGVDGEALIVKELETANGVVAGGSVDVILMLYDPVVELLGILILTV